MTLSDPLLKELKGHIAKLVLDSSPPYGDNNETVFLLCHCLEAIFLKGLLRTDGFTPWRTDSFSWFYQLVRKYHRIIPLSFKLVFDEVLNDTKTRTQTGKTRLLIRTCLKRRCLHVPVQFHVENEDHNDETLRVSYNKTSSIMGHEILSQIFLSLLQQLSQYEFQLDLNNSSFLDESWQIPRVIKAEFVPCDKLGLTLGFPLGFAVIVDIIEHSLAAEIAGTISVGDIMDEFNGIPLRNFYGSKIESTFRKYRSKPFTVTFIKATDSNGQLYLPAIKLYRLLGLDPEHVAFSRSLHLSREENNEIDLDLTNSNEQDGLLHGELSVTRDPCNLIDMSDDTKHDGKNEPLKEHESNPNLATGRKNALDPRTDDLTKQTDSDTLVDIDLQSSSPIDEKGNNTWSNDLLAENFDSLWDGDKSNSCSKEDNNLQSSKSHCSDLIGPNNGQKEGASSVFQSKFVDDSSPFMV